LSFSDSAALDTTVNKKEKWALNPFSILPNAIAAQAVFFQHPLYEDVIATIRVL
jgi:hypothetical protein